MSIAIAPDLYPELDKAGALYVDAINYVPRAPTQPVPPWPARPIRVNTNYLEKYPVLDESGKPIVVDESEQSWVVAVSSQFKSRAAEFKAYLQKQRTGSSDVMVLFRHTGRCSVNRHRRNSLTSRSASSGWHPAKRCSASTRS